MIDRREMLKLSAAGLGSLAVSCSGRVPETSAPARPGPFKYRVSVGWLRDLASEPAPNDKWPCIRWDDKLLEDQVRYLDTEAELGMNCNCAWGLFRSTDWPVPFEKVIDEARAEKLKAFVDAAHARGLKILAGVGIYSWGFDEVIRKVPGVSGGSSRQVMCAFSEPAWEWQQKVLDFHMEPRWGLDGISMQSADQGRCECPRCSRLSPARYHALLLTRCAAYVRRNRPDWVIGQASWGLRVDLPEELEPVREISAAVDYMVEVRELSAETGRRAEIIAGLGCAFGSLGGVFLEPPQHWERLRWFLPCGLGSARSLSRLRRDGGLACEYFYRPFGNPVEEVSWRTGAAVLSEPGTGPEEALRRAAGAVYGVSGESLDSLAGLLARGEEAYFSRVGFRPGHGSISLEPLIWKENPAAPGPPVYLEVMTAGARQDYARELRELKARLEEIDIPDRRAAVDTARCIDGTLRDIAALA
ncbi:MAG: hypothetical protein JXQ83_05425 [Candidatus Glassbacteria bacterium]|nr:hypothetical protein [Candidatus Glassbacteria bacterium]